MAHAARAAHLFSAAALTQDKMNIRLFVTPLRAAMTSVVVFAISYEALSLPDASYKSIKEVEDEKIERITRNQMSEQSFAGVVLVAEDSKIRHARAYANVAATSDKPHELNGEWRWASITKMVAGLITLQEAETGTLRLDDSVASYLSDAPAHFKAVTIRNLLNHTSGIANPESIEPDPDTGLTKWVTDENPSFDYCYGTPEANPSERFDYNACDFVVLADVLNSITGLSFNDLVAERIVRRFGLNSIRVVVDPYDDAKVTGTKDGIPVQNDLRLSNLGAAAAIVGQPGDLLKLTQYFLAKKIIADNKLLEEFSHGIPKLGYVALSAWGYQANLDGCEQQVTIIERQGHIAGTKVLTLQAPLLRRSIVAFSNRDETDWGWIWQGKGMSFELASEVFCSSPSQTPQLPNNHLQTTKR